MNYNVLDYLDSASEKHANKIAFSDGKNAITFRDLQCQAKSIGSHIANSIDCSIRLPIVVFVDRNVESIISFFGVVYSGNFYVPIDSKMPKHRIELIFSTLNPVAAIEITGSDSKMLADISYHGLSITFEASTATVIDDELLIGIRNRLIDIDPLYTIFTSGSTGVPKGVVISHKSVIDLAEWLVDTFKFTENDVLGNQTPFYFDGSVKDIYITLKTGATMYIIGRKYFSFPKLLTEILNEKGITSILWATSAVCLIGNSGILSEVELKYLNKVFFAGEAMPAKQLNIWRKNLPQATFVNLYGPTEVTVDCTYYIVDRDFADDEYIPIGVACKNKEILVLNSDDRLVCAEEIGELCVRGTGLALGYYNDPERTKLVFVQNPMHNFFEDKIYRTGDMVKHNDRNELVFLSRKDFQIKHMGNRIELGEIEVIVNAIKNVTSAVCIYDLNDKKIVLFYTSYNNVGVDIINMIKDKLPKYMFPNVVKQYIGSMPYNSNGKIDRLKLEEIYLNEKSQGS